MRELLEFDDAGASDDEPAKGVTVGDIRAWHDQYENLLTSWAEVRQLLAEERTAMLSVIHTAGGTVDGHPTSRVNILQRIRQLIAA